MYLIEGEENGFASIPVSIYWDAAASEDDFKGGPVDPQFKGASETR
jgi:hypothetical protein